MDILSLMREKLSYSAEIIMMLFAIPILLHSRKKSKISGKSICRLQRKRIKWNGCADWTRA